MLTPCGAPACGAPPRAPPLGRRTRTRQARPHGRDGAAALAWAPLALAADQLGRHQRRRAPPPTRRRAPPLATRPPPPTARLRDASGTALPAPHPAARRLLGRRGAGRLDWPLRRRWLDRRLGRVRRRGCGGCVSPLEAVRLEAAHQLCLLAAGVEACRRERLAQLRHPQLRRLGESRLEALACTGRL